MNADTPVYDAALAEAKRRTRKQSPERAALVEMDEATDPLRHRATGPHLHFNPLNITQKEI